MATAKSKALGKAGKMDKHFGVNPKNNQWEFMGKNYVHPDYKKVKK
jgi:hypothetical protein